MAVFFLNPHLRQREMTMLWSLFLFFFNISFIDFFISSIFGLVAQMVKNLPAMRETWVQNPGLGRSPGEGNSYPFQYSGLENSTDKGDQQATVPGVAKSGTEHDWVTSHTSLCDGFLQLQWVSATLCCGAWAPHCCRFSCCRAWTQGLRELQQFWRKGLVASWPMGSSQNRDRTRVPGAARWILNCWTIRKVPLFLFF